MFIDDTLLPFFHFALYFMPPCHTPVLMRELACRRYFAMAAEGLRCRRGRYAP